MGWATLLIGALADGHDDFCEGAPGDCTQHNCIGKDSCKDMTIECEKVDTCVIACIGESACGGNTEVDATAAEYAAFLCDGKDSCKGNTVLSCGSGPCYLSCTGDETACEDTTAKVGDAKSFECEGFCDDGEVIPAPFV